MAYCTNCGKQLLEGAAFCTECGKPVSAAPQYVAPADTGSVYASPAGPATVSNAYLSTESSGSWQGTPSVSPVRAPRDEALIGRIRETGGSPLHLAMILCMAATVILNVLSRGSSFFGIPTDPSDFSFIGSLIGNLPAILAAAGLAMFYVECRNGAEIKGNGLGLYKASKVCLIAFFVLATAAAVLGSIAIFAFSGLSGLREILKQAGIGSSEYGDWLSADFVAGMIVFILIGFVIVVVLAILMQAKLIRGANIVRDALETGAKGNWFPVFPVVIETIIAVFCVLAAIGMIGSEIGYIRAGSPEAAATVLPLISSVVTAAQAVIAVILLSRIRNAVN